MMLCHGAPLSRDMHNAIHGCGFAALEQFKRVQGKVLKPSKILLSSFLKASASVGALTQGYLLHDQVVRQGLKSERVVGKTFMDMYVKCGSLEACSSLTALEEGIEVHIAILNSGCSNDDGVVVNGLIKMHGKSRNMHDTIVQFFVMHRLESMTRLQTSTNRRRMNQRMLDSEQNCLETYESYTCSYEGHGVCTKCCMVMAKKGVF